MPEPDALSGRELDVAVAEKVMGLIPQVDFGLRPAHQWEWNEHSEYNTLFCHWCWNSSQDWCQGPEDVSPHIAARPCWNPPPSYSTDGNAMLQVLNVLIQHDWQPELWYEDGAWHAELRSLSREEGLVSETATELPAAVCRAALRAVDAV
jgi:hypothetical protein